MENYWKNDTPARLFIKAHKNELEDPTRMSDKLLSEAIKHCCTTQNPYSYELMRRTRRPR